MEHRVTEHTLDSGTKGLLVHVPGASVYNLVIRFNSGFQFGDFDTYELPHVVEHLIACGSKAYPEPNQFKVEIAKNGAYRNAYTSPRNNGYVVECAAFELDRILDLFEEYLARPLFPAEALPTELSNVSEELRRNITEHENQLAINFLNRTYPQDYLPYETRLDQLAAITHNKVLNYYQATHTAANARFYIAGDLPPKRAALILQRLERIFGSLPSGKRLEYQELQGRGVDEPIVIERDIQQIYYMAELYAGGLSDQERRALKLLRVILFVGYASRIYGEARRRGLAYHIAGSVGAGAHSSSLGFSGNVSHEHAAPLFELAARQLLALRDDGPTPAETQAAISLAVGSMNRSYQKAGDMLGFYLGLYDAEERIISMAEEEAGLRALQAKDVQRAAQLIRTDAPHAFGVLGEVTEPELGKLHEIVAKLWQ